MTFSQMYTLKKDSFSSHSKIVNLIKSNLKKGSILDVGCASGYIESLLPKSDYEFFGIDSNEEVISVAKKNYKEVWNLDIEKEVPNLKIKFDILIFADILEHLRDPSFVLSRYLKFGKNRSLIIISTPNIANFVIRLFLLFGHFDYSDRGILDRTHLRFFTLDNLKKMLKEVNLEILDVEVTPLPFSEIFPRFKSSKFIFVLSFLADSLSSLWKRMFAYQFVILARKI